MDDRSVIFASMCLLSVTGWVYQREPITNIAMHVSVASRISNSIFSMALRFAGYLSGFWIIVNMNFEDRHLWAFN